MVVMRSLPAERRLATLARAGVDLEGWSAQVATTLAAFHETARRSTDISAAATPEPCVPRGTPTSRRPNASSAPSSIPRGTRRSGPRPSAGWMRTPTCWPTASPRETCATVTVTSRPRTSSASTTVSAFSIASSSPTSSASATCAPTWRSSSWTSNVWGGPMRPSGSFSTTSPVPGPPCRSRSSTTTSPSAPTCGPRWPACSTSRGSEGAIVPHVSCTTLALHHVRRSRQALVLVGGLPGAGKSTLAAGLAAETGWALLRSDEVRRELRPPGGSEAVDAYTPAAVAAVYLELVRRARPILEGGESAILDASWIDAARRSEAARLAADTGSELLELCCTCDDAVATARMETRSRRGERRVRRHSPGPGRHDRTDGCLGVGHGRRHLAPHGRPKASRGLWVRGAGAASGAGPGTMRSVALKNRGVSARRGDDEVPGAGTPRRRPTSGKVTAPRGGVGTFGPISSPLSGTR